jgi:glycosyltransferase involved in cell wall biosynthesis
MAAPSGRADAPALYITYDGLTDPLGRSQVLPYLTGLARKGHRLHILSCEKPARLEADGERIRHICAEAGIAWHPRRYHKWPPVLSSVYDASMLQRAAIRLHRRYRFGLVHCRSYIPAAAGLVLKQRFGARFLFDMRGFWPDEKAEGNSWDLSRPLYRRIYGYFKALERRLLRGADHIVSLTEAGKKQMLTRPELKGNPARITVIPCCVDFDHFPLVDPARRAAARAVLGIADKARVVAYLGSLGSWYMLEEMLDFFRVYGEHHRDAVFLLVSHDDADNIRAAAAARGVSPQSLVIRAASRDEVPKLMAAADLGIFFIRPVFSKIASSPTKMGEMLALGLPLVTNGGVGDVSRIVDDTGCGVAVSDFDEASYRRAIAQAEAHDVPPEELRRRALPWFDVELGIERYDRIYRNLSVPGRGGGAPS